MWRLCPKKKNFKIKRIHFPARVPWIPVPRECISEWQDLHERNVKNTLDNSEKIQLLFYGASIVQDFQTIGKKIYDEYFVPLGGTANYGIKGDCTEHMLWRIRNGEVTEGLNPSVCVIHIGTNNLASNTVNDIAMGILFNVIELRERLPNTKILLLGVLPRTSEAGTVLTSAINDVIKHLDNGKTIRFLDMKEHFYKGGDDFVTELFNKDLLHLSEAGYRKWAEVMNPLLQEMLNSN